MNLKSFVSRVLSNQEGDLPTEDATAFKETLAILLDLKSYTDFDAISQVRLSESGEVVLIHPEGSRNVVDKLRSMFPFLLPNTLLYRHAPIQPPQVPTRGYLRLASNASTPKSAKAATTSKKMAAFVSIE